MKKKSKVLRQAQALQHQRRPPRVIRCLSRRGMTQMGSITESKGHLPGKNFCFRTKRTWLKMKISISGSLMTINYRQAPMGQAWWIPMVATTVRHHGYLAAQTLAFIHPITCMEVIQQVYHPHPHPPPLTRMGGVELPWFHFLRANCLLSTRWPFIRRWINKHSKRMIRDKISILSLPVPYTQDLLCQLSKLLSKQVIITVFENI